MTTELDRCAARLRTSLDLFEAGLDLQRMNFKRQHPGASELELDQLVIDWLRERAASEFVATHLVVRKVTER